jgi:hypothetical protein
MLKGLKRKFKFQKHEFPAEGFGVGEGFYPYGIGTIEFYVSLLKDLLLPEISEVTLNNLKNRLYPEKIYSTDVFCFEPDLDKKVLNSSMRFRVTEYNQLLYSCFGFSHIENSTMEFLSKLPAELSHYKGKVYKPTFTKTRIERNEANIWPTIMANADKYGEVKVIGRYSDKQKSTDSLIEALLVTDYLTYGPENRSGPFADNKFIYIRFNKTPFSDVIKVLETFLDFSYKNCPYLKRK